MSKKPIRHDVVRRTDLPTPPSGHVPQQVPPGVPYYDPNTKQYVQPVSPPAQGVPAPPPGHSPIDQMVVGMGFEKGSDVQKFSGESYFITNPDGSKQSVRRGYVEDISHTAAPDDGTGDVPEAMSKKRLAVGVLLVVLAVMILADVVGVPHVRTGEGRFASLEGIKEVSNPDAPLVVLKRLDRSVFLYTIDGIGWALRSAAGKDS